MLDAGARDGDIDLKPRIAIHLCGCPMPEQAAERRYVAGFLGCLILISVAVVYSRANKSEISDSPSAWPVHVSESGLSLGELPASKNYVVSLPITNDSDQAVDISQFKTSCGCTFVSPSSLVIPAHGTRPVQVGIDLFQLAGRAEAFRAPFEVTIHPVMPAGLGSLSWKLKGVVLFPSILDSNEVSFTGANVVVEGEVAPEQVIVGHLADRRCSVSIENPSQRVSVSLLPPDDSGKFSISIRPSPQQAGPFEYHVRIKISNDQGRLIQEVPIGIIGEMIPENHFLPREMSFGAQVIGTKASQDVILRCNRTDLVDLSCTSSDVATKIIDEIDKHSLLIRVTVAPAGVGPSHPLLQATCLDRRENFVTVELPIRYHGMAVQRTHSLRP